MDDSTTPILSFRFSVEISEYPGDDTNWQSVKGISKSLDTTVIHSGGDARNAYHLPNHTVYEDLVLERGLISKTSPLYEWCQKMIDSGGDFRINGIEPKEINVSLKNASGDSLVTWNFENAYPVKMELSEFRADKDAIAIETITLKYSAFSRSGDNINYSGSSGSLLDYF
ncbi:MAG: hypothetical protein CMB82_05725 [Flammeovirgaceae bacterium]|nr:hypothetical protein [Flammeovirgaceae bacterium]|tara:strand:+ start:852 stop:1361 length:510 start_codon:yes stop_codon:yes gene_type:complete